MNKEEWREKTTEAVKGLGLSDVTERALLDVVFEVHDAYEEKVTELRQHMAGLGAECLRLRHEKLVLQSELRAAKKKRAR